MGGWGWLGWLAVASAVVYLLSVLQRRTTTLEVRARVWRPSAPDFVYPEMAEGTRLGEYLRRRRNFGVAVAGGGTRGFAVAHGAVRALRDAGLLREVRYLSTTSGSVWFGVALYYQAQDSLEEFLGRSMPPEELHPETLTGPGAGSAILRMGNGWLRQYPKGWQARGAREDAETPDLEASRRRAAEERWGLPRGVLDRLLPCASREDLCSCVVGALPDTSLEGLWNIVSGYLALHPFGLATPYSLHCHETELERVRAQVGNRSRIYVARDISQDLPFHISQSAVLAPHTGLSRADPLVTFPLEHTPIYTGTAPSYEGTRAHPYGGLGDALVDSFAWLGKALEPIGAERVAEVRMLQRFELFNLGQLSALAGIATAYIADFQVQYNLSSCAVTAAEKILPHALLWSPLNTDSNSQPISRRVAVGDAGVYDDLGHLPLLRRRVDRMVIFDSSAIHDNATGDDAENLCQMTYTRAAFGQLGCLDPQYPPGSPNSKLARNFSTVFAPSEFQPFWSRVVALYEAKEPVVVRGKFTVVDNPFLGITGGWKAEVVWVIALPIASWRSALPAGTAGMLPGWFPNYRAADIRTQVELSALSQFSSWLTEKAALGEIRAMLEEDGSETAAFV